LSAHVYALMHTHICTYDYVYIHIFIPLPEKKHNSRNCASLLVDFFFNKDIFHEV